MVLLSQVKCIFFDCTRIWPMYGVSNTRYLTLLAGRALSFLVQQQHLYTCTFVEYVFAGKTSRKSHMQTFFKQLFFCFKYLFKVPMKWNFHLLFYSKLLNSMILRFVIFEFGLRTSTYRFFLELQSWPIWIKMCDIPCAVKICKLVWLTS